MAITAADVKNLRERTGATNGWFDSKNAISRMSPSVLRRIWIVCSESSPSKRGEIGPRSTTRTETMLMHAANTTAKNADSTESKPVARRRQRISGDLRGGFPPGENGSSLIV